VPTQLLLNDQAGASSHRVRRQHKAGRHLDHTADTKSCRVLWQLDGTLFIVVQGNKHNIFLSVTTMSFMMDVQP